MDGIMDEVRIFDLQFDRDFREKFYKGCEKIFDEAYLTDHSFVREFETKYAKFCNSKFSLAVSNGTAAIEVALRALDVRGKTVIIPTNTFIATSVAALNAGAKFKALDIENDYFGLCPVALEKELENKKYDIAAVVVVHIGGHVSTHFTKIKEICDKHAIPIVEDAAHAHGASFKGKKAGALGSFGAFSHFMTKVMTTGEGGSVTCNDQRLFDRAYSTRRFGLDPQNTISHLREGSNFKMTEFQALMGILELERIEGRIQKRRAIAQHYQKRLQGTSWKVLSDTEDTQGSYYKQVMISPIAREKVILHFQKNKVALTGGVFFIPLHRQPVYQQQHSDRDFHVANAFAENHICPPCYPELSLEGVDRACDLLLELAR